MSSHQNGCSWDSGNKVTNFSNSNKCTAKRRVFLNLPQTVGVKNKEHDNVCTDLWASMNRPPLCSYCHRRQPVTRRTSVWRHATSTTGRRNAVGPMPGWLAYLQYAQDNVAWSKWWSQVRRQHVRHLQTDHDDVIFAMNLNIWPLVPPHSQWLVSGVTLGSHPQIKSVRTSSSFKYKVTGNKLACS